MSTSIKIILHKRYKCDKSGNLYVQKIKNSKKEYESLGLGKLPEKYWNYEKQRVKKNDFVNYEFFNQEIERKLGTLLANQNNTVSGNPRKLNIDFPGYFETIVNSDKLKVKHGTRIKYTTVLSKLKEYLIKENIITLPFNELDVTFLEHLQVYLKNSGLETNTSIHYLKIIRLILNRSQKEKNFIKIEDPFKHYQFEKKEKKIKQTLTEEELFIIINTSIPDAKLDRIRNLFLFQFFTSGMRVSDLITLRYNSFSNSRLKYRMFKTNNHIELPLTPILLNIINRVLQLTPDLNNTRFSKQSKENIAILNSVRLKREQSFKKTSISSEPQWRPPIPGGIINKIPLFIHSSTKPVGYKSFNNYDLILRSMNYQDLTEEFENLKEFNEKKGIVKISSSSSLSLNFSSEYESKKKNIDFWLKSIIIYLDKLKINYFNELINILNTRSTGKKIKNNFIFGLLKDEDFIKTPDLSLIDYDQYQLLHRVRVLYNKNLKQLQAHLKINKNLHSHLPRISYTNIAMSIDGINTRDISFNLGHSSISITDEYLKTGFNSKRVDAVQKKFEDYIGNFEN